MPLRTTARMTPLSPGQSPPPVSTPIRMRDLRVVSSVGRVAPSSRHPTRRARLGWRNVPSRHRHRIRLRHRRTGRHAGRGRPGRPAGRRLPGVPPSNAWNRDVSRLPVDTRSLAYIASINGNGNRVLHADFGGNGEYGIPYTVVARSQPRLPTRFVEYGDESDPGPYPVPPGRSSRAGRRPARPRRAAAGRAGSTSSTTRGERAAGGRPAAEPYSTCARTGSVRPAGRRPTPPACRSSRAWPATTRSGPVPSATPCDSRCNDPSAPTSPRPGTSPPTTATRTSRPWACGCD